jgi:hypothetical protein
VDLSEALRLIKAGHRLTRVRWDNSESYIVAQPGYPDGIEINGNTARATGIEQGTVCRFGPYCMARLADGSFVPWVPTQVDLFAEDWRIA